VAFAASGADQFDGLLAFGFAAAGDNNFGF
jgi:hypothetical protein